MKHEGSTAKMIQMKNKENLFNEPIHCASEMLQIVLNFVSLFYIFIVSGWFQGVVQNRQSKSRAFPIMLDANTNSRGKVCSLLAVLLV